MTNEPITTSVPGRTSETVSPRFMRLKGPIAGVAAGIASDLRVDVTLVRIAWIVSVCLGFGFFLYPMCWLAFPKASEPNSAERSRLLGVCVRGARRWNQPVGLLRLIAISLLFISFGSVAIGYVIAHFVIPATNEA